MGIQVRNLTKKFGKVLACQDINFEVDDQEIAVLLGPSGCGKTTTLRCIAGLEKPDEGNIFIAGRDVTNKAPKERNVAFVFQDIALFPHLSVRKNIRFGLDVQKRGSEEERERKVQEVASMLHIDELLDRKPSELSGGQQQRVAVGRALILNPAVFLLDEAFANLDANLKIELRTETKKLQRELGIATVFVTHDQEEAMVLADKIILMRSGLMVQVGTPNNIYNDPSNIFSVRFIGSPATNLLDGTISKQGEGVSMKYQDFTIPLSLSDDTVSELSEGAKVTLGIRPENIEITQTRKRNTLQAKVVVVEPLGSRTAIYMETNAGQEIRSLKPPEKAKLRTGQEVNVSLNINQGWLFDEEGRRIK